MTIVLDKLAASNVKIPSVPTCNVELEEYLSGLVRVSFDHIEEFRGVFNQRLTTTGGQCFYEKGRIEMNPRIDVPIEFLSTALHELSHLEEFVAYGTSGHRSPWVRIFDSAIRRYELEGVIIPSRGHDHSSLQKVRKPRAKTRYFCSDSKCTKHDDPIRATGKQTALINAGTLIPLCSKCSSVLQSRIYF